MEINQLIRILTFIIGIIFQAAEFIDLMARERDIASNLDTLLDHTFILARPMEQMEPKCFPLLPRFNSCTSVKLTFQVILAMLASVL